MLLNVSKVAKSFGVDEVLSDVTFRIDRREKVQLVGRNGCGKTTLLRILTGQMSPDTGSVQLSRGATIGYLRQEHHFDVGRTVLEEATEARREQIALKQRLDELSDRIEHNPTVEELDEYATLHEHFLEQEGYAAERDLKIVLQRMGFDEDTYTKPAHKLSGGEKTRLALSRLLLEQPDLLILDEPTNHLDLQATEWLENWLRSYPGAVLLVSHDREFLRAVGDRVLDMRDGTVKSYPGPYEKYRQLRAEEEVRQAEVAKRQASEIAKLDEYVRRFMNSQRTAQARGRLKMKDKLVSTQVHAPTNERGMKASFAATKRAGDIIFEAKSLAVGFGETSLITGLDWTVQNGDRWGVVGENGAGKSTLIKALLGKLSLQSGTVRQGSNLEIGYFSQDAVELDLTQSPLDYLVWEFDQTPESARNLLGQFLFSGDDVFRPIKTLSGGEKNKLVLAGLTTLRPNVLILDEPTNHLDMDSREVLAGVLRQYAGTLLLISHDRWLLGEVTNRTLDVRRDGVRQFPGSYAEYRLRESRPAAAAVPERKIVVETSALSPRELSKEIGRLAKAIELTESEVAEAEQRIQSLEQNLATPPNGADIIAMSKQYAREKQTLDDLMHRWHDETERLDSLRAQQGAGDV
ncbi:MAG: ABC-F family ATP-binding cassette domain-containing protein [Methanoregulaceae archaeon]|jgi:ATP-binding cassette subfamily F protein 3|nr:ABC-F family ATP-binding cassette domain-containing protein [Methanoregulaceae archaeon]